MKTRYLTFAAGQVIRVEERANYFHLLETSAPIDIGFIRDGAVFADAKAVEFGYFTEPEEGYTGFDIASATAQTIKIGMAHGRGGYNRTSGDFVIKGQQGLFSQTQLSLTNVNQVALAANVGRKYLLIQNNDAVAVMRVKLNGATATATSGLRILAGMSLDLQGFVCSGQINCMMETSSATANNVEVVEG